MMTPSRLVLVSTVAAGCLALAACGNSSTLAGSAAGKGAVAPVSSPVFTGTLPAQPATGASRAGAVYNIMLTGKGTGDNVAITVFEPATLVGGRQYPLVLQSHGYAGSRTKSTSSNPASDALSPGNIPSLLAQGYGVISISERGSDESSGTIRVMDPDFEGKDLISILDWAEANLAWLAYGIGVDGSAHNPIIGSIGGSYGGMYQYLINNIDPRHRLDAIVPQIAPADLTYSLFPNNTIKAGWDSILFGAGASAGNNLDRGHTDPFVTNFFTAGLSSNSIANNGRDFFYYHSNAYFCNGRSVASNGDIGATPGVAGKPLVPERPPVHSVKTNALIFQGMRDTLFTFNNAYQNYQCFKSEGGDVRLLSYQSGHNTLQAVPDPGNASYQPKGNELDSNCGAINVDTATIAFFNEHLKGMKGAADSLPTKPCLSLQMGDAVLVDGVTTGKAGKEVTIPSTMVVAGGPIDVPTTVPLGITAAAGGDVLGGIPYLEVDIQPVNAAQPGEAILYFGIGQTHNGVPGNYDLVDNQVTPVRGAGKHMVDLVGVAERLAAGDQLALLIYGQHDQYHATGSINAASPSVVPVTVVGKVWVPMLGNLPNKQ